MSGLGLGRLDCQTQYGNQIQRVETMMGQSKEVNQKDCWLETEEPSAQRRGERHEGGQGVTIGRRTDHDQGRVQTSPHSPNFLVQVCLLSPPPSNPTRPDRINQQRR